MFTSTCHKKRTTLRASEETKFSINEEMLLSVDSAALDPWGIFFVSKDAWSQHLLGAKHWDWNELQLWKRMRRSFPL